MHGALVGGASQEGGGRVERCAIKSDKSDGRDWVVQYSGMG
jgi:hypothetical protein